MAKGNKPETKKVKAKRARAKWAKAKNAKGKKPKPRTPKTFHRFLDLPKELRLKVWEQALLEARPDRRIIVYQLRVVPFKQSISPLLLVNYESRACATAFYNVKLDVYAVPGLSDSQIESLDKLKQWPRIKGIKRAVDGKIHGYTDEFIRSDFALERYMVGFGVHGGAYSHGPRKYDAELACSPRLQEEERQRITLKEMEYTVDLEDHWDEYVEEELRSLGADSVAKIKKSELSKGALYISPMHDVFIEGYECGRHFHFENAPETFGAKLEQRVACHHITAMLDAATRAKVSTLVLVRSRTVKGSRHNVFASRKGITYNGQPLAFWHHRDRRWSQENFPSVKSYFRLRPYSYTSPGFLEQLTEADGPELSRILEVWAKKGSRLDSKGKTVWDFVKMKGLRKRVEVREPGLKPADWTREMMAHWDVGQAESM